jgi:hypothetical protein
VKRNEIHLAGAKADRNQISDVRSQKTASPPEAGEKSVEKLQKSEKL